MTQRGTRIVVPESGKRLVAFVALQPGPTDRMFAACTLWPDGSEERASGNLRTALWRLRGAGISVVETDAHTVRLPEDAIVDVAVLIAWADRVIVGAAEPLDLRLPSEVHAAVDLLPGWYEEWVAFERDAIRQRMLHALEALARRLMERGRGADAVEAAMTAVRIEPLRESAHRVLAEMHLAEGNVVEALRVYRDYRDRIRRELGIEPSSRFVELLGHDLPRSVLVGR